MIYIERTAATTDTLPHILWDNKVPEGTLTATTTATGTSVANLQNRGTYNFWKPTALPATVSLDNGSVKTFDCMAIVAHSLGSSGSTINLEYNDGGWVSVTGDITPTDDSTIFVLFDSTDAEDWRLRISGSTIPFMGILMLGEVFTIPGGVRAPYTPIWQAETFQLMTSESLGGHFIENRVVSQGAATQIDLVAVERSFSESNLQPFRRYYNEGGPFIWAANPQEFTQDVGYVWRQPGAEMKPTFDQDGIWVSVSMGVKGYVKY
jgi:hypothetical protein